MANKTLIAELRSGTGTSESRRLRSAKQIPAVVYGHGEAKSIVIDAHVFETTFKHISENELIELKIGKESHTVLIKDYQADILKNRVTHLDFYEIEKGKSLKTHVPIKLVGSAKGVKEGGILENPLHELEIECLPKDLPESISINIEELEAGHAIHVGDLKLAEGLRVLNSAEQVVAFIGHAKAAASAEPEEQEAVAEGAEA